MLRRSLLSFIAGILVVLGGYSLAPQPQAMACQGGGPGSDTHLLGIIPPWHHYLTCDGDGGVSNDITDINVIWSIGFAVLEGITATIGLLGVLFVLWGGVKYMTSQGSPDGTAQARKTIVAAIAGIVIGASSTVFVQFAFRTLGATGLGTRPGSDGSSAVQAVLGVAYGAIGAIAVIYIVIGAIKFATSTGDPGKAASARNTIIYALVGLVVAIAAGTITDFVISEI